MPGCDFFKRRGSGGGGRQACWYCRHLTSDPPTDAEVEEMFLDDLQKRFEEMQGKANWKAVFGEVLEVDGRRLIPVASVQYGFGMGGGQGPTGRGGPRTRSPQKDGNPSGGGYGGGGGGGVRIEPVALIDITEGRLRVEPIINVTRLAVIGLIVAGWSVFWIARHLNKDTGRASATR